MLGRTFAVINQKGGVGKTVTSIQIGSILRKMGKKVLMIDMDPQCNLSYASKANLNTYSILDAMLGDANVRDIIQKVENYDIIVSNGNLASYSKRFDGDGKEYRVKEVIDPLRELYDFIIFDSPPALGDITIGLLTASDSFIIPATSDVFAFEGLKQIYMTYQVVKKYTNPNLKIDGVLITRYNEKIDKLMIPSFEKIASKIGTQLFKTKIRESSYVKLSLVKRVNLLEFKDKKIAALTDYIKFTKELIGKWKGE